MLKLYHAEPAANSLKALISFKEKGLEFESVYVDLHKFQQHEPSFVAINPEGQVPVLDHDGVIITHTTVIGEYLEDAFPVPPLWPQTPAGRAEARQLELKSDEVFFPHIVKLMGLEATPADPAAVAARNAASGFYEEMNARLESRSFLAGEYSYADIAFFMAQLFGERKGAIMTGGTPRLSGWRTRMLKRPAVRTVAGRMAAWLASQGRPVPEYLTRALPPRT